MKTFKSLSARLLFAGIALLGFQASQAASLGLTAIEPDIATSGASIVYDFSDFCFDINGSGQSGACGTTETGGGPARDFSGALNESLSSGQLSIDGSGNFFTVMDEAGNDTGFLTGGIYTLDANFNGDGSFSDGTISITYGGTFDLSGAGVSGDFTSGTAVIGDITAFGFSEVAGAAGTFEFEFDPSGTLSNDFYDNLLVSIGAGSIASSFDLAGYDASFQGDFAGTANVDTFVPVPAAVWLFGSAMIGLIGFGRRRSKRLS